MRNLLSIKNLRTYFYLEQGVARVIDDISLKVEETETVALVGESGCGKTILALSILNLVPPPGKIVEGIIEFQGKDLLSLSEREFQSLRGKEIAMVFQEPLSSLNPVLTIGFQIIESLVYHLNLSQEEAKEKAIKLLKEVELPKAELLFYNYPHQLSGGMRQRVMIAIALSCEPKLLILDEPTTALDVTIQAQILELIKKIKEEKKLSVILITHDLAIVQDLAERVEIIYAGKIVEQASSSEIFSSPSHPYTLGLLNSIPDLEHSKERLKAIGGIVPEPINKPKGCPFHLRCERKIEFCDKDFPQITQISSAHFVWCYNHF